MVVYSQSMDPNLLWKPELIAEEHFIYKHKQDWPERLDTRTWYETKGNTFGMDQTNG